MPHALIVGAFGQDNPGDEALLTATVRAVRASAGWEPVVATARPSETSDALGVLTVDASPLAAGRAAMRADALIVGGGTLFKELHPRSGRGPGSLLRSAALLTSAVHLRGRPVVLLGVGAAPIVRSTNQRLARSLARRADLLVLRDDESARLLAGLGVAAPLRVGADLTWAVLGDHRVRSAGTGAPIGVAVSHLAGGTEFEERLASALVAAAGDRAIELEPWQGSPRLGPDARVASRLAAQIGDRATVTDPPADLAQAVERASTRAATVALRFHGAVASASAGTPFLAVAHEPKLVALATRLGQPAVVPGASAAALAAGLDAALAGPAAGDAALALERRRATASLELLGLVLSGGGPASHLADLSLVPAPVPA